MDENKRTEAKSIRTPFPFGPMTEETKWTGAKSNGGTSFHEQSSGASKNAKVSEHLSSPEVTEGLIGSTTGDIRNIWAALNAGTLPTSLMHRIAELADVCLQFHQAFHEMSAQVQSISVLRTGLQEQGLLQENYPAHVLDDTALRRRLLVDNNPNRVLNEIVAALRQRQKLGIDTGDTAGDGETTGVSFAQMDGVEKLHEASWDVSEFISTDRKGDVVCTENWGAIDPDVFFASHCADLDVFGRIRAQRYERVHEVLHVSLNVSRLTISNQNIFCRWCGAQ